jgi:hypothetical protein
MRAGRLVLGVFLAAAAIGGVVAGPAMHRPVLVELFTSQGCSDCPAADRLVTELAKRKDVIALSFPITYWDMLGWKDTFATDANTQRQKSYAKAMKHSGIYTPQMILDGRIDVVGNQRERVLAAIAARANDTGADSYIPISLANASGRLEIVIPASRMKGQALGQALGTIWIARTLAQGAVHVERGENSNHRLHYTNVVRDLRRAGEWSGEAMKLDVPLHLANVKHDGIAVILQAREYGPVLGAALLQLPASDRIVGQP